MVKLNKSKILALTSILLVFFFSQTEASYKCNTKLLNTFRLKGLKTSVAEEMEICPTVRDTCCSMFDQVEILQLWKKTSYFKVQDHFIELEKWDDKVMKMYYKFKKLERSDMIFFYKSNTPAPYLHHFCYYRRFPIKSYPAQVLGKNMEWMLPGIGPIQGIDLSAIRSKEYNRIKRTGLDDKLPSYRFKMRSAKKFYKEFYEIAKLMYQSRRLPYYHKKYLDEKRRFKGLRFNGLIPKAKKIELPGDHDKPTPKRAKLLAKRAAKNRKPNTYKFSDKFEGKFDSEIKGLYSKERKMKDNNNDTKQKDKGKNGKPETTDYVNQDMETLKIKRRRKKKQIGAGGDDDALKLRPKIDLRRGKHRRKLKKRHIRTHQNRKLKDLKGKISQQWNNVFGNGKIPTQQQMTKPILQPQSQSKFS